MRTSLFFIIVAASASSTLAAKDYSKHQLLKATFASEEQLAFLQNLHLNQNYDIWSLDVKRKSAVILLPENDGSKLVNHLGKAGIHFETVVENVQDLFDWERKLIEERKLKHSKDSNDFDLFNYHNYQEIHDYLDDLQGNSLA